MTVKEKINVVAEIFRDAQQRAEPLLKELGPYLDVAREAERLGLAADASGEQILDAFAGKLDLSVPAAVDVPQLLSTAAPAEIRQAGEKLTAMSHTVGAMVGQLVGIIAGFR